jgi:tetratricopeptide (TPR) repeat protein
MKLMYRIIIIVIFILLPVSRSVSQDLPGEKYKKGTEFYSAGNYREALAQWASLYNTGYRSASLEYNIGNAFFKLNNIPGAILYYERALLLKPADEDIIYNLQIARTMVVDKFETIPELFFVNWFNFLSLSLSTNTWAYISLFSFILLLLFFSLYIYSSRYRNKVTGFWAAVFMLIISVSSVTFALRNRTLVYNNHGAIIFSPLVNGKSSPDSSGNDLFVLHEGTKVTIEDEVGEWYEIRLSDGNKGWVPANCLDKI